jgi:hypothetical protein
MEKQPLSPEGFSQIDIAKILVETIDCNGLWAQRSRLLEF